MATTLNHGAVQNPFALTVTPVDFSLTAGTDIPAPPQTPVKEPPTPGGGPLTSHPTTPEKIPGAYPSSDEENESESPEQKHMEPVTSTSTPDHSPPMQLHRKPSGVRRLFSMNNLRSSFGSSRTSLALTRPSTDTPTTSINDRPFTPSVSSTASSSPMHLKQPLRQKRSGGNWFKRKSSLFLMSRDGTLDAVDEGRALDGRGTKRLKGAYSLPLLPEISELGGEDFGSGDLGWDSSVFKRV